jgi:hypothetical protein
VLVTYGAGGGSYVAVTGQATSVQVVVFIITGVAGVSSDILQTPTDTRRLVTEKQSRVARHPLTTMWITLTLLASKAIAGCEVPVAIHTL